MLTGGRLVGCFQTSPFTLISDDKYVKLGLKLFALIGLTVYCFWGCETLSPPIPNPSGKGCSCFAQALGTNLVQELYWTNSTTGNWVSGTSFYIPESGGTLVMYADHSIACSTNNPNVVMLQWNCGTNTPVFEYLTLPPVCLGFSSTVSFNCSNCSFAANQSGMKCGEMTKPIPKATK